MKNTDSNADGITQPTIAHCFMRTSAPQCSNGYSYERQELQIQEYARKHNLVLKSFGGVSGRSNLSASIAEELAQAGDAAKKLGAPAPVLLIASIDRLSRGSLAEVTALLLNLLQSGVEIHTVDDGRKYTAAMLDQNPTQVVWQLAMMICQTERASRRRSRIAKHAWAVRKGKALSPKND